MPVMILDPALRSGWEPDMPVEDSLLRRFLINWTDSIEAHGVAQDGRAPRRDDLTAFDLGRPSFGGNVATLLAPLFPADVDEVWTALDAFYGFTRGDATGDVWMFSPWPTPDLRPHGWTLVGYQPLMLRPAGGEAPPDPSGLRIEGVRDAVSPRAFETTMVRGFEARELEGERPGTLFGAGLLDDDRVRLWIGWEDNQPVCAAAVFVAAGINDVTLVGTIPEARRRGYGAALTWRATLADPALPALLIATDEGRAVSERMGYMALFRFTVWLRERPGSAHGDG